VSPLLTLRILSWSSLISPRTSQSHHQSPASLLCRRQPSLSPLASAHVLARGHRTHQTNQPSLTRRQRPSSSQPPKSQPARGMAPLPPAVSKHFKGASLFIPYTCPPLSCSGNKKTTDKSASQTMSSPIKFISLPSYRCSIVCSPGIESTASSSSPDKGEFFEWTNALHILF